MYKDIYEKYSPILKQRLSDERFYHCKCVAERAEYLAVLHGENTEQAYIAGLLHDICREDDYQSQLHMIEKFDIILSNIHLKVPPILHQYTGAKYMEKMLGITDKKVLDAVSCHTTAKPNMTQFEKIIFLADLTSKDRNFDGIEKARELCESNMDLAILDNLKHIINKCVKNNNYIVEESFNAYNYFIEILKSKGNI